MERSIARELAVPAIMVAFISLYAFDARDLTPVTLIFPGALIAVIAVALGWSLLSTFSGVRTEAAPDDEADVDETAGPILSLKPWLLIAIPAIFIAVFDYLGGLVTFVALVACSHLAFGLKPHPRAMLIGVGLSLMVYLLLRYMLYVRFPAGILGIG